MRRGLHRGEESEMNKNAQFANQCRRMERDMYTAATHMIARKRRGRTVLAVCSIAALTFLCIVGMVAASIYTP